MKNKLFISLISFVLVFAILFTFPLTAFADANGSVNMKLDGYDRQSLMDEGIITSATSQYYVYMPIMSDGIKYDRFNPNSIYPSEAGRWTCSKWGLGNYNSTTNYYTFSKRIFFADTTRRYTNNYNFSQNFFVIPKNTSVRLSFLIRLTGEVQYYRDVYELNDISIYTNELHQSSDKFVSFNTGGESSVYMGSYVGEGTNCSQWIISKTFTAGNTDVYVNSIHLNMNAIDWDASILPLEYCGTMFLTCLFIEYLEPDKDPADKFSLLSFFSSVGNWFYDIYNNIVNGFSNVGNWFTGLGESIGSYFIDLWDNITDGFNNIVSVISAPFHSWLEPIINIVQFGVNGFISLAQGIFTLVGGSS